MTGFKEPIVAKALEGGAMGLLHKPFQIKDLLTKLADVTKPVILLVDDDADFAGGLGELLQAEGYKTSIAGTGADALARVHSGGVGVLILDLRLPVMDGLEVYKRLKAQGNPPPTIIISGDPEMNGETIAALRDMQVKDCLAKPVDPTALLATIASLVA
jgi:two-component system response regulator HydG